MDDVRIATLAGSPTTIPGERMAQLAAQLRGELLVAGDAGYEAARPVWNAMIDARPAAIARCRSAADVMHAVRFAREHDLLVAVRGGGHNIAGKGTVDGGLLVDCSPMRGVRIDPVRRTARVEPGALLADLDHDAQAFGLATPLGINSTTGVAGLALGGGYGWLSRRHGLTADNLLSADVVTADGAMLTASEADHADLFWGLRGGGGNFGVVTSFELRLHPIGPEVLAGLVVHPLANAAAVLRQYREFVANAPEELTVWVVMRQAPPLPFLAPEVHGTPVVVLAACWTGDRARGERVLAPLRAIPGAHADVIGPMPYASWQQAFDPLLVPGFRNYWKTHNFAALGDDLLDALIARTRQLPGPMCEIFLAHLGGAIARVPDEETAYMGRSAPFVMNVHARWDDAAQDDTFTGWARGVYQATAAHATAGAYVNFLTADEAARVPSAYGPNYERLAALKAKYDPTNVFRINQNVTPRAAEGRTQPGLGRPSQPEVRA